MARAEPTAWPTLDLSLDADITIVGLGPGPTHEITLGVWQALQQARSLFVRTTHHPCVTLLADHLPWQSFDYLYTANARFDQVYAQMVAQLMAAATAPDHRPGELVYAVPGHPWVGEATTPLLLAQAQQQGLTVQLLGGSSFVAPTFGAVGIDLMNGGQVVDAMLLARQHYPQVEVCHPLLVGQLYSRLLASDVKLTLLNAYPAEHPVTLIQAAGSAAQRTRQLPLHELDHRDDLDHLTTLFVPPLPAHSSFSDLQQIVAQLRAPDGCPWDQAQTLLSLRSSLLDECCELLEAIDAEDDAHTVEELGDLLLVITMLIQIGVEEGRFQLGSIMRRIVHKLIRRHPHVFGDLSVENLDQLFANWDAIKAQEKQDQGLTLPGPLDGIAAALPALEKARKLQSKAEKAGLLKRAELAAHVPQGDRLLPVGGGAETLGELLWQLVALAHTRGLNAEEALRQHIAHFRAAV